MISVGIARFFFGFFCSVLVSDELDCDETKKYFRSFAFCDF